MKTFPKPIETKSTQKILEQMSNCIYEINIDKDNLGIAIFSCVKYLNKSIPIMITNYEIINEEYLSNNTSIIVSINNEIKIINFGNAKYLNKEYNLAIIEIKPIKNNEIYFLDLDDYLYKKEPEQYFNRETIYTIHYNKENNISVLYGTIKTIRKFEIDYLSYPHLINLCWPIFNSSNNKLIGLYNNNLNHSNKGIFFKYMINEFIKEYRHIMSNQNKKNEINILINIDKKDLNKKIYFLNNYAYEENEELFLLNKTNTELYINNFNKKIEYKKYFIPKKEGDFNIKLKFSINLRDCSYMFAGCENIIKINFIYFNTKYVTNMKYMFHRCKRLKSIDLFSFDTKIVTDMSDMFSYCENLNDLDLTSFDTTNVINMKYMFYNCNKLTNLTFLKPKEEIDEIALDEIRPSLNPNFHIYSKEINKNEIVNKYKNKIRISVYVDKENINKEIYFLDNYEYENNEGIKHYHDNLKELNKSNTDLYINKYHNKLDFKKYFIPKKEGIYTILLEFNVNLTDCSYMFAGCENIIKIKFDSFDTKYVTNMKYMFYDCNSMKKIKLSSFDTKNVANMSNMFSGCNQLNSLDLISFNTINVTNMSDMFSFCNNLYSINLSFLNTTNVTNMADMFSYCNNLIELDLSSFDTKNVNNMSDMFKYCENLMGLDLSNFDTKNVTNMRNMFSDCYNLKKLNIDNFDTRNVTIMRAMFSGCKNLNQLDLSNFDVKSVVDVKGIFYECKKEVIEKNKAIFKKFNQEEMYQYF